MLSCKFWSLNSVGQWLHCVQLMLKFSVLLQSKYTEHALPIYRPNAACSEWWNLIFEWWKTVHESSVSLSLCVCVCICRIFPLYSSGFLLTEILNSVWNLMCELPLDLFAMIIAWDSMVHWIMTVFFVSVFRSKARCLYSCTLYNWVEVYEKSLAFYVLGVIWLSVHAVVLFCSRLYDHCQTFFHVSALTLRCGYTVVIYHAASLGPAWAYIHSS